MSTRRLAYFESWVDPAALEVFRSQSEIALLKLSYSASVATTTAALATAHGYQISPRTELRPPWFADAAFLSRCPELLAVSSTGAGFDVIDVEACSAAGVIVCNQGGTNQEAVAEHTLGLMLGLAKRITETDRALRRASNLERFSYAGSELAGKTAGIIGIGHIGTRTSKLCRAFEMQVIAYDPYLNTAEIQSRGAEKVDLGSLLRDADYVLVHCPRTAETMGMLGVKEFATMKRSAFFINTARGGIHDERALHAALQARRLAGAGMDVFLDEPPKPDHPLFSLDNVIATPHTAGITKEALRTMAIAAAEQWIAIFKGCVPPRLINPEAWPRYRTRFEVIFGFPPNRLATA